MSYSSGGESNSKKWPRMDVPSMNKANEILGHSEINSRMKCTLEEFG
jgi:hypothetical protein